MFACLLLALFCLCCHHTLGTHLLTHEDLRLLTPVSRNSGVDNVRSSDLEHIHNGFIVLVLERLGLGNRLRTISDWYIISLLTNRKLIISWFPTPECNISLPDLIESVPQSIYILNRPIPLTSVALEGKSIPSYIEGLTYLQNLFSESGLIAEVVNTERADFWMSSLGFIARKTSFINHPADILITTYDGEITVENIPCQYYLHQRHSLFTELKPKQEFLTTITQVLSDYFAGYIPVGIHIRMTDPVFDWAVVPPFGGKSEASEFGQGARLEHFLQIMQAIQQHFTYPLYASSPSAESSTDYRSLVRFYVASNDPVVKETVLTYFPTAVTFNFPVVRRDSEEGMKHAFLEWLMLSSMSLIVNTYGSSFAVEASHRSKVPLVGIYEGFAIHHDSELLPHCGIMQYAKYFSSSAKPMSFREGTVDRREVQGMSISLNICDYLQNFGITEAYCITTTPSEN